MQSKETLRRKIKAALKTVPGEYFLGVGMQVVQYIRCLPAWSECSSVLAFLPCKNEIETGPLIRRSLFEGKAVFIPRTEGDDLRFYRIRSLDEPWELNPLGIREPAPQTANLLHREHFPALILTPGLAFTRNGRRLGRGKGFYDRFFAGLNGEGNIRQPYFALGLCLEVQLVPDLPVDNRDWRVHGVCTEQGIQVGCPHLAEDD